MLVTGLGLGVVLVSVSVSVMTGAADEESGMLSGLNTTGHEIGGTIGIAVLATIAAGSGGTATPSALIAGIGDAFLVIAATAAAAGIIAADRAALGCHLPAQAATRPARRHPLGVAMHALRNSKQSRRPQTRPAIDGLVVSGLTELALGALTGWPMAIAVSRPQDLGKLGIRSGARLRAMAPRPRSCSAA